MDIQTKDGILLRNIPDGTPDEAIKARIQQIRAQGSGNLQSSAPMRFIQGMRDPIDAGAQLLAHAVPDSVTSAIDKPFAAMRNSDSPLLQTIGDRFFADPSAQQTDQRIQQTEQQYQNARGAEPGFDAARLAGNVLSPANAALARVLPMSATSNIGRAATGAVAGGAGGALIPVTSGNDFWADKGLQTGMGAVTGAVVTPIIGKVVDAIAPKVSALVGRITGSTEQKAAQSSLETDQLIAKALQEVNAKVDDVPPQVMQEIRQQVNDALKSGNKLDAAALLRQKDFNALEVPPTLGQLNRDPTQFARERNLRGADERLATRFNEQSRRLGELLGGYGGGAQEPQAAGKLLAEHLAKVDKQAGSEVSAAYKAAREATGKELDVPLQGLAQDIASVEKNYGKANPAVRWAKSYFSDLGITGAKQTKTFNVEEAEQALQQINKLRGSDAATNNALSEISGAIKKAVTSADDQGGVFAGPRALAAQRFKMQDMVPALKSAAEGDASADRFVSQYLIRGETKDVQALAKLLQKTSPELYEQARAQIGQELSKAAYGANVAGDKAIRPEMLAKALKQMGTERLGAFFSPEEISNMHRIARVGGYIESIPAGSAVNTSNSFTAALPYMARVPGLYHLANAIRAGMDLSKGFTNSLAVNNALAAKVPAGAAELPAGTQQALARALMLGGVGSGMAAGNAVQP